MYPQISSGKQMLKTGIRELKNHLSRYVLSAKEGKTVLITEHGRPVARLVGEPGSQKATLRDKLAPLALKGLVRLPEQELIRDFLPPLKVKGEPLSKMILEDRR